MMSKINNEKGFNRISLIVFGILLAASVLFAEETAAKQATFNKNKDIILTDGGKTDYLLAVSQNPSKMEKMAAEEFVKYLKAVSGVSLNICKEGQLERTDKIIYMGWTEFARRQGIDFKKLGKEEWLIKTVEKNLIITGGRPQGTLYGTFDFIEKQLGVHCFDPFSVTLSPKKKITIGQLNIKQKPAFELFRGVAMYYNQFDPDNEEKSIYFTVFNKCGDWTRMARPYPGKWAKIGSPGSNHTFGYYITPSEYYKSHPEYFAMNADGKRIVTPKGLLDKHRWTNLCLSNNDVREIFIRKLRAYIEADRKKAKKKGVQPPFIYMIEENDCVTHHCFCPDCREIIKKYGADSGLTLDFVNFIANNIKDDYPEIIVDTFAYNHALEAPNKIKPADNVMIRWCDSYSKSSLVRPFTDPKNSEMKNSFDRWTKIAKNMAVWDYWRKYVPNTPGFYAPLINISALKPSLQYYRDHNVKSYFVESQMFNHLSKGTASDDFNSFSPLRCWLGLKLMANPDADTESLMNTFFTGYYGKAAGKMREFLDYLEKRQNQCSQRLVSTSREDYHKAHLDLDFFVKAQKLLDQAEKACGNNQYNKIRVIRERIPVDSALLHLEPALRKTYCAEGESYPFDRIKVIRRYEHNWEKYADYFYSDKSKKMLIPFLKKRIDFLKSMPLASRDNFAYSADHIEDAEISIDGNLNEVAWKKASAFYLTSFNKLDPLKVKTKLKALWSKNNLYISFKCYDNKIDDMKYSKTQTPPKNIWNGSTVEIFINPNCDRKTYYQIVMNPAGFILGNAVTTIEGVKNFDFTWNPNAKMSVKKNKESWDVELAIPFTSFNFTPKEKISLVANFNRTRVLNSDKKGFQQQTWTPLISKGFHDINKYGTIQLNYNNGEKLFTSFESAMTSPLVNPAHGTLAFFSNEKMSDGAYSLKVEYPPAPNEPHQGIKIKINNDWSKYSVLTGDIFLVGDEKLALTARLEDQTGGKLHRYYKGRTLNPGWNKNIVILNLNMAKKTTEIDLKNANILYLYLSKTKKKRVIFIDALKLKP
jgi:Domain of unknown function (DUF4838)/Carbohydrate family 9 binding domain-like/Glycosyl hydrolase family 67 N-terminus